MTSRGPHEHPHLDRYARRFEQAVGDARERLTPPPRVRFELRRKSMHVLTAVLAVPVLLFAPIWVMLTIAAIVVVLITVAYSIERRRLLVVNPIEEALHEAVTEPIQTILQKTRRPGESYPWSPVLYTFSIVVIALGTQYLGIPFAFAFAAYAVLGLGDTASALYGIAYGRSPLPWNRKKTWEGTAAGIIVGFIAAVLFASADFAFRGQVLPLLIFPVLALGAIAGMLAETAPNTQDNLMIPLSAWFVMVAVAIPLGLTG